LCTRKESSPSATWAILVGAHTSISIDFIIDLPFFVSFDSILVVVDRLTKMVHFIPCNKTITNKKTTKLFFNHVFWYHGLLENIVFDRGHNLHPSSRGSSLNY